MPVVVHRERGQVPPRVGPRATLRALVAASLVASPALAAQGRPGAAAPRSRPLQGSLERRLAQLIDVSPFDRATWGIYAVDDRGRVLYQRNADRLFVPASNTKLVVTAAALALLPADYRVRTSLRSEEHTSELQSLAYLVCRLLLEKKKKIIRQQDMIR